MYVGAQLEVVVVTELRAAEFFPYPLCVLIIGVADVLSTQSTIEGLLGWHLRLGESLEAVYVFLRVNSLTS